MRKLLIGLALGIGLTACAGIQPPQSPAQAVYAAHGAYATALTAALAYKQLPSCKAAKPPCSDPGLVVQIQAADDLAYEALSGAQRAVRTPGFGADRMQTAIAVANQAIATFSAIAAKTRSP